MLTRYRAAVSRPGRANSTMMDQRELPDGWDKDIPVFPADAKGVAIAR